MHEEHDEPERKEAVRLGRKPYDVVDYACLRVE